MIRSILRCAAAYGFGSALFAIGAAVLFWVDKTTGAATFLAIFAILLAVWEVNQTVKTACKGGKP